MDIKQSIKITREAFEKGFAESKYYNSQSQDDNQLELILKSLNIKSGAKILDLGTGSGYLAFAIAQKNPEITVVGLDIVSETLKGNRKKAMELKLNNIAFTDYDGLDFNFEDGTFDVIATRYALHHFPEINSTFKEISRVLKQGGQLFISDPTQNENDINGFVNEYMKVKQDGHIKFYTEEEITNLAWNVGLSPDTLFRTKIRFPRKEAEKYRMLLDRYNEQVINGYQVQIIGDEIFITQQVLNLSFIKL